MTDKVECPNCGEKALSKIWNKIDPQPCECCGKKQEMKEMTL